MSDTSIEVVLRMPFLTLNSANVSFSKQELIWKSYTIAKTLPTTKQIKLINKKEFAKTVLDEQSKIFMVYRAALKLPL